MQDIEDHFAFIARDNVDAALRFLEAYDNAVRRIAEFPDIGSVRKIGRKRPQEFRLWIPEGFNRYVIVYAVRSDSIWVSRVLNAAQDYTRG